MMAKSPRCFRAHKLARKGDFNSTVMRLNSSTIGRVCLPSWIVCTWRASSRGRESVSKKDEQRHRNCTWHQDSCSVLSSSSDRFAVSPELLSELGSFQVPQMPFFFSPLPPSLRATLTPARPLLLPPPRGCPDGTVHGFPIGVSQIHQSSGAPFSKSFLLHVAFIAHLPFRSVPVLTCSRSCHLVHSFGFALRARLVLLLVSSCMLLPTILSESLYFFLSRASSVSPEDIDSTCSRDSGMPC